MTGRRLAAALLAAVGLAPATLAAGLALHVALDHAPAAAHEPARLADVVAAGGPAVGRGAEHEHEIGVAGDLSVRIAPAPATVQAATAVDSAAGEPTPRTTEALAALPGPAPQRVVGPPLLALLSILRV